MLRQRDPLQAPGRRFANFVLTNIPIRGDDGARAFGANDQAAAAAPGFSEVGGHRPTRGIDRPALTRRALGVMSVLR